MTRIHMIGNAHLDPVWLWRWQDGFAEVKATFRSALDRMAEFPDFVFTCAGARYYRWVEESDPGMFEEIRRRVAEGRWVLAGGWWIQPDCNLPSGESFARHALYSQRYFREKFGRIASFGYNVDSFGHNAMLPQLLNLSGMRDYVMMRPGSHEKDLPGSAFWWEGPDGSRVLTYRIPYEYCTGFDSLRIAGKCDAVAELADRQGHPMMLFYGVGNHGGGPTAANLRAVEGLRAERGRQEIDYSDPGAYFAELRRSGADYPIVKDDLQHHASGCYSTVSEIKANNRKAECRLVAAEKFMTVAHRLLGLPYCGDAVKRAWESVLFNQFHDILGGCSIREAYADARDFHGEALKTAGDLINGALQKISWAIDTTRGLPSIGGKQLDWALWEREGAGAPIVIFNPLSWQVTAPARIGKALSAVTDSEGISLPVQSVRAPQTNGSDKWDTLFMAAVPPMGYRVYWAHTAEPFPPEPAEGMLAAQDAALENDFLRLELDAETGFISRLHDKASGMDVFRGPGAVPIVIEDSETDTWAHGVFEFRKEIGQFGGASVRLIESGPVRATLRAVSRYGNSVLRQDFTVTRGIPGVEVAVALNWQEGHRILKLSFPVNADDPVSTYEIPYGAFARPADGRENPGQAWLDVSGTAGGRPFGLAIANTAKYSYDVLGGDMRLTAVRSALYADHYGERDEFCEYMDQGEQSFRYVLLPHEGRWQESNITRRCEELLNPFVTVPETYHAGPLPLEAGFIAISAANVQATALKQAESGEGAVLRCRETIGEPTPDVEIALPFIGARWRASFRPFEIKTLRIGADGAAHETNLLEDDA